MIAIRASKTRDLKPRQRLHRLRALAESLRYYADGRFLGDWRGPTRFSRVLAVLEDSEALGRHLREWGACFFLVRHSRPRELRPADSVFDAQFEELVSGDDFVLYRLTGVPCSRQSR